MDLFNLSKILTIFDWVCIAILSVVLLLGAIFMSQNIWMTIVLIMPLFFGIIIVIVLSLSSIGEFIGFVKKSPGLMIYSIFMRILWLTFYAGTFYLIQPFAKLSGLIVVPIMLTTYGLTRLILQIYIVVNFEKLTKTEDSPAESQRNY